MDSEAVALPARVIPGEIPRAEILGVGETVIAKETGNRAADSLVPAVALNSWRAIADRAEDQTTLNLGTRHRVCDHLAAGEVDSVLPVAAPGESLVGDTVLPLISKNG